MAVSRRRVHKMGAKSTFDKYDLYLKAVQAPDVDAEFYRNVYRELRRRDPKSLREDFCGTFVLCCEWVKLSPRFHAYGVDLDPEPLQYGRTHYLKRLSERQRERLHLLEKDVLKQGLPHVDIAIAMNFSYFLFKTRDLLKKYFQNVHQSLNKNGLFMMDVFGGSACHDESQEKTKYRNFSYYWQQAGFDPVTNRAKFFIHFKLPGQKLYENVFSYDWRMWSIPELRELLAEVGFRRTHVYWEGTNKKGEGNSVFTRTEKGEPCEAWVAYIAAEK